MRMKEEILEDLSHLPTGSVHQTQTQTKTTKALVEVSIDIRDQLTALIVILGSVEKIAYRSG